MDDEGVRVEGTVEDIGDSERTARRLAPLLLLRGGVSLVAGIVLLFWPGVGIAVAAIALGIFLLADGIERLVDILRRPAGSGRLDALGLAGSILRIVFGAVILFNPSGTGSFWASLVFIIAGLNLVAGSVFLFWKDKNLRDNPMDAGMAILMLILGLLMIMMPMISALFLLRAVGVVLILGAIPSLALGLRSR